MCVCVSKKVMITHVERKTEKERAEKNLSVFDSQLFGEYDGQSIKIETICL